MKVWSETKDKKRHKVTVVFEDGSVDTDVFYPPRVPASYKAHDGETYEVLVDGTGIDADWLVPYHEDKDYGSVCSLKQLKRRYSDWLTYELKVPWVSMKWEKLDASSHP